MTKTLAWGQSPIHGADAMNKNPASLFESGSHINGIVSFVIFIIITGIALAFRKKLTKLVGSNKFWWIYGGISIPFYLGGRYIPFVIQSLRAPEGTWARGMLFQNIMATNMCAFLLVLFMVIIMIPKYRVKVGVIVAPWSFLGGSLTMIGLAMSNSSNNFFMFLFFKQSLAWGTNSIGQNPTEVFDSYQYFSSHAWLLFTSIIILMGAKKYSLQDFGWTISFVFVYALWVGLSIGVSYLFKNPIQHDVGGILPADWQTSTDNAALHEKYYPGLFKTLNIFHLKGPSAVINGLKTFFILISLVGFLQYRFINFRNEDTKIKIYYKKVHELCKQKISKMKKLSK